MWRMAYRLPSYLHRSRYGTLYLRLTVPPDLRPIVGKAEIYRSLQTASIRQAADSAQPLKIALQRLFDRLRESREEKLSEGHHEPPEALLREVVAQLEAEDRERQQEALAELVRARKLRAILDEHEVERSQQEAAHAAELARLRVEHQRKIQSLQERARATAIAAHGLGHRQAVVAYGTHSAPPPAPPSPLLADAIAAFINERMRTGKQWDDKTLEKRRNWFRLFEQFLHEQLGREPRIRDCDKQALMDFLDLLKQLPPNITKNHAGKRLSDIAALGLPPMAAASINGLMGFLSGFFKWCKEDPAFKIDVNPAYRRTVEDNPTKELREFTDGELAALLTSPAYTLRTFLHPYRYWLIPLALHTGARLGELCQLTLSDFIEVDGIPCIHINDEEEKQLKNRNAKRLVPIHSFLLELGLMRYVETMRQRGESRLFPEINLSISPSHNASNWFNDKGRYSDSCGVSDPDTNFHSFRRTFITSAGNVTGGGARLQDIAPLVGHETGLITGDIYFGSRRNAIERQATVEKFRLPEAICALIPPIEQVTFGKGPPRKRRAAQS